MILLWSRQLLLRTSLSSLKVSFENEKLHSVMKLIQVGPSAFAIVRHRGECVTLIQHNDSVIVVPQLLTSEAVQTDVRDVQDFVEILCSRFFLLNCFISHVCSPFKVSTHIMTILL